VATSIGLSWGCSDETGPQVGANNTKPRRECPEGQSAAGPDVTDGTVWPD
jgi:hypothetical protein